MSARPPISQAVNYLREFYLAQGIKLADLMFRLTIFEDCRFEVVRVEEAGLIVYFCCSEGITTIYDPASAKPGVYYLRPDKFGKFYWIGTRKTRFLEMIREWYELPDSKKMEIIFTLFPRSSIDLPLKTNEHNAP